MRWFSMAFNGQLANFTELRSELLELTDYHLTRETDTKIIMHYLGHELRGDEQYCASPTFASENGLG